jgi:acetylornithine/succinyldiaminopimelate/putrescine aminotransferase
VQNKEAILLKSLSKFGIRGKGFFHCIQFDSEMINQKIIQRCFEKGILTDWFLFAADCLRIAPPLTISEEELEWGCKMISESINEMIH